MVHPPTPVPMTPEQIHLVRTTFAPLKPVAGRTARWFYDRLFIIDPTLRPMFKGSLKDQGRKLMATLAFVVGHLDRPAQLLPAVEALGRRHAGYGVQAMHYAAVGDALLWTLAKVLGPDFTPEARAAWLAAYVLLADVMQQAAANAEVNP